MWENASKLYSAVPHQSDINCCDISKSGVLATCSTDRTIKLWRLNKDGLVQLSQSPLSGHSYSVNVVKFSRHGTILASASTDGSAVLWDVKTGEKLLSAYSPSGFSFRSCALSPDSAFFVAGGDDDKVHMWNVATKELVRTISEHEATVNSVAFSPDGQILVSTDLNGKLFGWSGQPNHHAILFSVMEAHDLGVMCLDFSPVTSKTALTAFYTLATCGSDGLVKLWNIEIGSKNVMEMIVESFAHVGNAMCVKFNPQGEYLATTGGDKCVKIWSYPELTCVRTIEGFSRYVTSCCFDKTGGILVATSRNLQVWSKDSSLALLNNNDESKDKNFTEERFNLHLTKNRKKVKVLEKCTPATSSSDVTTCDTYQNLLAIGTTGMNITLWNLETCSGSNHDGKIEEHKSSPLKGHTYSVYSLKFSKSGLLVSGSLDGHVILWDPELGTILKRMMNPNKVGFRVVAISADNETIVAGGDDDLVHIWSQHLYTNVKGHDNTVFALDISPDGRYLVSGSSDESIKVWDLTTWPPSRLSSSEEVHDLGITCCAFQPAPTISTLSDGQLLPSSTTPTSSPKRPLEHRMTLATGGNDSFIRIWWLDEVTSNIKARQVLEDHGSSIMNLTFSENGEFLGSTAGDRTARIWDTKIYRCLFVLDEHERYVTSCAFSLQHSLVITTSEDYFKVWSVDFHAEERSGRKDPGGMFQSIPVSEWSSQEVKAWCRSIELADSFNEAVLDDLNGTKLLALSKDVLEKLGVKTADSLKILEQIQWLRHGNFKSRTIEFRGEEIPEEFLCPITHEIMDNPVSLSDGFIYDEMAIKEWLLTRKQTSPMTNLELPDLKMVPCDQLKIRIQQYVKHR